MSGESSKLQVGLVLGSDSDWHVVREAGKVLDDFGVGYEVNVISAHRSPQAAHDYVLLGNAASIDTELSVYAPEVDYYDKGVRDFAFIQKDLSALRKRWPERYYVITSVDQIGVEPESLIGTATVHFRFVLFKGDKFYRGDANTILVFDLSTKTPKAILVREHKTRKEKG